MDARIAKCIVSKMVPSKDEKRYYVTLNEPEGTWDVTVPNDDANLPHLQTLYAAHQQFLPVSVTFVLKPYVYDKSLRLVAHIHSVGQVQGQSRDGSAAKS
jgi:hypothetical protein